MVTFQKFFTVTTLAVYTRQHLCELIQSAPYIPRGRRNENSVVELKSPSKTELVERVKAILATKGLTL